MASSQQPRNRGSRSGVSPDHRTSTVTEGNFPQPTPQQPPKYRIRVASGPWAYSTGDDGDDWPRGVYRLNGGTWDEMAPLPYVLERLARRDGAARRTTYDYRLSMTPLADPDGVAICDDEELTTGTWAAKLDVALSADNKVCIAVATAVRHTAREHSTAREMAPRWSVAGTLDLPPTDVGPAGYGQLAGTEEQAQQVWAEIVHLATDAPKLALVLGAAMGGVHVGPLDRQAFLMLLVGGGGQGKTTALNVAASIYGNPARGEVVKSWNTTSIGLTQELGGLAVLPAFRDEFGAAGLTGPKLEQLVFQITEGGRSTGGKTGTPRTSAPWQSVLFATGNDSILGELSNEGVARRVLEVETPITRDAESAERLEELAKSAYGWPLRWLREGGYDPAGFGQLVAEVERELPLPGGAVPRGLGRHLAVAVAGAELLEQIVGGAAGLRAAALEAGQVLLAQMVQEVRESGITPGERVLAAVKEAVTARAGAYPTRDRYRGDLDKGWGLPREVEGWLLTNDPALDGDLAVLTHRLDAICVEAGITNARTGLRELDKRGVLVRGADTEGRLRRRLPVAGEKTAPAVYVFRLSDDVLLDDHTGNAPKDQPGPGTGNSAADSQNEPLTCDDAVSDGREADVAAFPVDGGNAATGNRTGKRSCDAMTCTDSDRGEGSVPGVPGVPGSDEQLSHVREPVVVGAAGPVWTTDREPAPCRLCGRSSSACVDELGPVHPACALKTPAHDSSEKSAENPSEPSEDTHGREYPSGEATGPETAAQGATRGRGRRARGTARLRLAGVLDTAGLWLPGQDEPMPVELPADAGAAYRLALEYELRQLWMHPSVHDALGVPARVAATENAAAGFAHEWVASSDVSCDPAGLATWVNVAAAGGGGRRVGLVFPGFDDNRVGWHTASSGQALVTALEVFAAAVGENYYLSPNETGYAIIRAAASDQGELSVRELPPPATGKIAAAHGWDRPLTDEEDIGGGWVHRWDLNGAQPSVFRVLHLGVGEPVLHDRPGFEMGRDKHRAGYWLVDPPADVSRLDTRLPDLLRPWRTSRHGGVGQDPAWLMTDDVWLLAELGVPLEIREAWLWPRAKQLLRPIGERYVAARGELVERRQTEEAAELAYEALKAVISSRIGDFNRQKQSGRIHRPDFQHAIIARAHANQYRRLRKVGLESGRYPIAQYEDAVYYVADSPDASAARPKGLPGRETEDGKQPAGLGEYKHEACLPLGMVREYAGANFNRQFKRIHERG